ncbi:unnamed protein product, partial [Polarella glacialis]
MAAFEAELFEGLHASAVSRLASGSSSSGRGQTEAFAELRANKDALAKPFSFRGREDTVDLPSLARHIQADRPRLASEALVKAVDEVSRTLRIHQHDSIKLVERALDQGGSNVLEAREAREAREVPKKCAAIYFRECHFQALCLHDMAQGLASSPPDKRSVAFFGLLGGKRLIASVFEALGVLLRDLSGDRAGDQRFLSHAGVMIQLLVETLFAYFSACRASVDEAEQ